MGKIQKLPDELVARIAAGEVIERPVYAVKELVENALDANASHIDIYIVDGGLSEITVTDDGDGMNKEDLALSILPHATSKIKTEDDLLSIRSLGFRGEALASIASVSRVTLESRTKLAQVGNVLVAENGKILKQFEKGLPIGTSIHVLKLFDQTPARKKFMKSIKTEFRLIYEYISAFSLAYPTVQFRLYKDGELYANFDKDLVNRMIEIFGEKVTLKLMNFHIKNTLFEADIFLSHPENSMANSSKLLQFVNTRNIQSGVVSLAIKEAYSNLLDVHSYPQGAIFITIPYQFVDVNVHPTKREVRFESSDIIFSEIKSAVLELLSKHNLTFGSIKDSATNRQIASELRKEVGELSISHIREEIIPEEIFIIDHTYIVFPQKNGLMMIDQHAAHEALLYDAYKVAFNKHKSESVELSEPLLVNLTKVQQLAMEEHQEILMRMGFEIEPFGGETWRVHSIPKLVDERRIENHIGEILEYLSTEKYPDIDHINNKMLAFLACKSAIKAGDRLTKTEALKLISDLGDNTSIYTCPHGRPVKRLLTVSELAKLFKRS